MIPYKQHTHQHKRHHTQFHKTRHKCCVSTHKPPHDQFLNLFNLELERLKEKKAQTLVKTVDLTVLEDYICCVGIVSGLVKMDVRKIVVVVEEVEAARTALEWALHNLFRYGDLITLLHVFCPSNSKSKRKTRLLRLKGYQLALSFKEICSSCFFNTNVEIIVTEGDDEGGRIAAMVRDIGAFALVVGLHDQSFLYRLAMTQSNIAHNFNCKVLAIKHPTLPPLRTSVAHAVTRTSSATSTPDSSTNVDFSQIEIGRLEYPEIPEPKVPYRICPDPTAIIWRRRKTRRNSS